SLLPPHHRRRMGQCRRKGSPARNALVCSALTVVSIQQPPAATLVPMALLGIDIGSSSIKCGLLNGPRVVGQAVTVPFKTTFAGVRAEVNPEAILRALGQALRHLGPRVRRAEAIALSTMSPSWLAMDRAGKAITP